MTQAAVTAKIQYRIGGMACGFCVATIGKAIGRSASSRPPAIAIDGEIVFASLPTEAELRAKIAARSASAGRRR